MKRRCRRSPRWCCDAPSRARGLSDATGPTWKRAARPRASAATHPGHSGRRWPQRPRYSSARQARANVSRAVRTRLSTRRRRGVSGAESLLRRAVCFLHFLSFPNDSLRTQPTARLTRTQHARRPRRSARGQCVIRHASGLNVRRIRVCGRDLPNTWRHTQPPVWTAESLLVFSRLPSRQKDDPYDSARSVLNTSESIPAHPGRAFTTPIQRPLPPRDGSLEAAPERI
ncbi:hypothetical protein SAMN05192548_1001291 [Paraburkholderia terricola]|jgi:hypothetical protein|uniref:Uncharacterized protein n=1 Tax=Paraburkholderia terricola TaxID=169427 RepID=A0A1M6IZF1_9BURK|nr:hypothetical protein SAMN05192547_100164 [Paraburkholderia sediminicola]SHJ39722.1 hypothetical protein SAMN05192548_1001291 [Paraburkholderia terricola]